MAASLRDEPAFRSNDQVAAAAATSLGAPPLITVPKIIKENQMFRKLHRFVGIGLAAVVSMFVAPAAQAQSEQQALVAKAQTTLSNFVRDPEMTWIQKNLGRAKG